MSLTGNQCTIRGGVRGGEQHNGDRSRPFRIIVFLAIVWSIAGAFVAVETLSVASFEFARVRRVVPPEMAISQQSPAAKSHCEEVLKSMPPFRPAPDVQAQSRYLAWRLGQRLGLAGALLASEATPSAVSAVLSSTTETSKVMGLPQVTAPPPGLAANALRDFSLFLQEDPQCVAAALSAHYSPEHAALFRFGASVAIAAFYRQIPEIGEVFGPEIETFGTGASISRSLWQPLLQARIDVRPGTDLKEAIDAIVYRIDEHIRRN
jgi:hypothetical protein